MSDAVAEQVLDQIRAAYGDPHEPDFNFEREESRRTVYVPLLCALTGDLLSDLELLCTITNVTDVNTDHGYRFYIRSINAWYLQLSFVGKYAALCRVDVDGQGLQLVEPHGPYREPLEERIVHHVAAHETALLGRDFLERPIQLTMFDTDPQNVKLYQALFTDVDILPWRHSR